LVLRERENHMKPWNEMTEQEKQAIIDEECRREQAFEEIAAFGEGAEIVNVLTGERWIAGKRQKKGSK